MRRKVRPGPIRSGLARLGWKGRNTLGYSALFLLPRRLPLTNTAMRLFHPLAVVKHARRWLRIGAICRSDPEHALDPADDAADRAAHDGADGPRAPVALVHPVRDAAGNTLGLGRHRQGDGSRNDACKQYLELHCVILLVDETPLHARQ